MAGLGHLSGQRGLSERSSRSSTTSRSTDIRCRPRGAGRSPTSANTAPRFFMNSGCFIKVHRERGFSIIQACNPPDLIFLAAAPFKLMGKRFIFDQHDVGPNCSSSNTATRASSIGRSCFSSGCSYAMADFVITANATFKDIAVRRGGKAPALGRGRLWRARPKAHPPRRARAGTARRRANSCSAISALSTSRTASIISCARSPNSSTVKGFRDFRAVVVGSGPALESVRALARSLGVEDFHPLHRLSQRRAAARAYQRL